VVEERKSVEKKSTHRIVAGPGAAIQENAKRRKVRRKEKWESQMRGKVTHSTYTSSHALKDRIVRRGRSRGI